LIDSTPKIKPMRMSWNSRHPQLQQDRIPTGLVYSSWATDPASSGLELEGAVPGDL
jgi:hypothetical protein